MRKVYHCRHKCCAVWVNCLHSSRAWRYQSTQNKTDQEGMQNWTKLPNGAKMQPRTICKNTCFVVCILFILKQTFSYLSDWATKLPGLRTTLRPDASWYPAFLSLLQASFSLFPSPSPNEKDSTPGFHANFIAWLTL